MDMGQPKAFNRWSEMIKFFISHKKEDAYTANKIANELKAMNVPYYLDILDFTITGSGKALTCLLYTSPSPRDRQKSRMPSSA